MASLPSETPPMAKAKTQKVRRRATSAFSKPYQNYALSKQKA
jgi:hypothetical protein